MTEMVVLTFDKRQDKECLAKVEGKLKEKVIPYEVATNEMGTQVLRASANGYVSCWRNTLVIMDSDLKESIEIPLSEITTIMGL
jgi:hypothetical protein